MAMLNQILGTPRNFETFHGLGQEDEIEGITLRLKFCDMM